MGTHFERAAAGEIQNYDCNLVTVKGNRRIINVTNMPIVVDGETVGVYGIAKNITEEREAEQLIDKAYQLGRIGTWEFDMQTHELTWSSMTKEVHGVDEDHQPTVESTIALFKEGVDRDTFAQACEDAIENEKPFDVELRIISGKGDERWIRATGEPEYRGGECIRFFGISQNVTDRRQAVEELQVALREKQTLLTEIHHRVKNNMALVSSLLQLQSYTTKDLDLQQALSQSQLRIQSMALVHEKLYQMERLSSIQFDEYTQELVETIQQTFDPANRIACTVSCDPLQLNVNQAVPCALILNELLTNTFKHAFRGRKEGEVTVTVCVDENERITIGIRDDGVGLPEDFKESDSKSLGFTIIHTLVKQLHARFDMSTDKGTLISLSFRRLETTGSSSSLGEQFE